MTSVRTSTRAWRELLRASTELLRGFEDTGDFGGLSVREYDVLRALAEHPGHAARLGALAEITYLPQPSMSRIVERLERAGLLARCASPEDGRGTLVRLTDAGRERQAEVGRRHVRSIHAAMTAGLSDADLHQLTDLLTRLRTRQ